MTNLEKVMEQFVKKLQSLVSTCLFFYSMKFGIINWLIKSKLKLSR